MNAVNLSLALITILLRRYVDKIFTSQCEIVVSNAPWLIESSLFKLCMYAYMFSVDLWRIPRNMKKGTVISVAKKCYGGAIAIKNKWARRKCLGKNRKSSWMMDNLMKNRETQQRALQYISSLTPHPQPSTRNSTMGEPSSYRETLNHKSTTSVHSNCNRNMPDVSASHRNEPLCNSCAMADPYYSPFNHDPSFQNHGFCHCANNRAFSNEQQCTALHAPNAFQHRAANFAAFNDQQIVSYGSNPYYERKICCTRRNPCPFSNPRLSSPPPGQAPPRQPQPCCARCCVQPDAPCTWRTISEPTISKRVATANELSDDSLLALLKMGRAKTRKCIKKVPPVRNLYTLRGRKIKLQDASHDGKAVGKTRSGKVYNYHSNKSRR